jgi:hypothetical protein
MIADSALVRIRNDRGFGTGPDPQSSRIRHSAKSAVIADSALALRRRPLDVPSGFDTGTS